MPDAGQLQDMSFGGGVAGSVFSPIAFAIIILAGLMLLLVARRKAIAPFFLAAILIPYDQVLVIGPMHFPMLRVLVLFGLFRVARAKFGQGEEIFKGGTNGLDIAFLILAIFQAIDGILLWQQSGEIVYQFGQLLTAFGVYLTLRYLIQDDADIIALLRVWAVVALILAGIMICEQVTAKNPLYMAIGGARAALAENVLDRDGKLRSTGSFAHPILAGTFGGISLPLFFALMWKDKKSQKLGIAAICACIAIALSASSSTSLLGLVAGIISLCLWPIRRNMRTLRWGIVATLVAGQLYMTSPVWHIISDIDFTGSSSSYHRYQLVDMCIRHFTSWALVGAKDFGTWGWDMWDLSDQYVAVADTSGLIPLVALISMLVMGFKYLGRMRAYVEERTDKAKELFIWALSASLFANLVAFLGISYFDQTIVAWYALLAMISATTLAVRNPSALPAAMPGISDIAPAPKGKLMPGWNRPKPAETVANGLSTRPMASRIGGIAFAVEKPVRKYN
jgi:hypothetical protein